MFTDRVAQDKFIAALEKLAEANIRAAVAHEENLKVRQKELEILQNTRKYDEEWFAIRSENEKVRRQREDEIMERNRKEWEFLDGQRKEMQERMELYKTKEDK